VFPYVYQSPPIAMGGLVGIMMSDVDSVTMAIADLYAEALLEAAQERDQEQAVLADYEELVSYMEREPDFEAFLTSELVDDDPRRATLEKLFRGRMNDLLLNMLQVLNNRHRCEFVDPLLRCVQLRMEARHDEQEIRVQTAVPLWDELRDAIRSVVGGWMGKTAIIREEVNPEILGGMVIYVGDVRVDGSVASRIATMRQRFADRISDEMHRSADYVAYAQT